MKKLQDFKAEKVELKNVYGGKIMNTFSCNTMTIGGSAGSSGRDDGSDEQDDK